MSQKNTSEAMQLTLFSAVHRVRDSASPEAGQGLPMSVISGLRWLESCGQPDHALSLWRMCLAATAAASSTQYEVTWTLKATPQHRFSFLLRYSARRTSDTGCLSWGYWPTPSASDTAERQIDAANIIHTKNGTLRHRNRAGGQTQIRLSQAVKWHTPAAQDSKNAMLPPSQAVRDTLPGDLLRNGEPVGAYLNPDWVETLMGLPPGWTSLAGRQGRA